MQQRLLCVYLLLGCIITCFGLSFGLTWRSNHHCYAGVCGSWLFPTQARLHVGVWYAWLLISVAFLTIRASNRAIRAFLSKGSMIPWLGRMTVGGLVLILWQTILYAILLVNWWPELRRYFTRRGEGLPGNITIAFVAQSGHLADVTMGLVLLPVTRHGALAAFFKLQPSTNFLFHLTQAYLLFVLIIIHGLSYAGWAALYNQARQRFRGVYPVLNPTYLYEEVWPGSHSSLAVWRASLIFSGGAATILMTAMLLTSFPLIRRKYFNVFYFTHLVGLLAIVIVCLHASTMFYCIAPGLSMWLLDWGLRSYELRRKLDSRLESLGRGWYSLTVQLPVSRLMGYREIKSPLAHFHIHHTASSRVELHPFTTTTHLASQKPVPCAHGEDFILVDFLFREMESKGSERPLHPSGQKRKQWTTKLASLIADEDSSIGGSLSEKDEGYEERCIGFPYQTVGEDMVMEGDLHFKPRTNSTEWGLQVPSQAKTVLDAPGRSRVDKDLECSLPVPSNKDSDDEIDKDSSKTTTDQSADLSSGSTTPSRYRASLGKKRARVPVSLRLEGPYFTAANPMAYETVVCLVAGTGITGAIAIAEAFQAHRKHWQRGSQHNARHEGSPSGGSRAVRRQRWRRCVVIWTVRADDYVEIPKIQALQNDGLNFRIHYTGRGRPRPDLTSALHEVCGQDGSRSWAYICGPGGFVSSAERACMKVSGLSWCTAM